MASVGVLVSAAALLLPCAVQALPQYYALQYDGCEVPKRAYGNHGAPRLDNSIEFQIWQGSQEDTVTEWEPQGVYNITVPIYEDADANQMNMWLWAQDGTLRRGAGNLAPCRAAWYSQAVAGSHTVEWTAPRSGNKVQLQVAMAIGPTDYYHIGTYNFQAVPEPPVAAPAPASAPAPAASRGANAPAPAATSSAPPAQASSSTADSGAAAGLAAVGGAAAGAVALAALLL